MAEPQAWTTQITKAEPNHLVVRGYALDQMMGRLSFAESIYLILRGELPPPKTRALLDAIFVASLDHGPAAPSGSAARTAASTGAPLNVSIASGILAINRFHGGAIEDCMATLGRAVEQARQQARPAAEVATELVASALSARKVLSGFGHRVHTKDPRTTRLFQLAQEAGVDGAYTQMARGIQESLKAAGKDLPINVDGAIAAVLCELGFVPALGNVFFMIGRVPGLAAQAYEEMTTQKPMRRIDFLAAQYEGPAERDLP